MENKYTFRHFNHFVGALNDDIVLGYTKRSNGLSAYPEDSFNMALYIGDDEKNVHQHQDMLAKEINFPVNHWMLPIQKHGANIKEVTSDHRGLNSRQLTDNFYDVDGIYSYEVGILLTMNYADCIPVYIWSETDNFHGLVHAGWRGTSLEITKKLIDVYQGRIEDLRVAIGPGISGSHYEVDKNVIDQLSYPLDAVVKTRTGYNLDLKKINQQQARDAGLSDQQIYVSDFGTEETPFFSYRLEKGNTGRALAFIGRKQTDD